MDKKLLKMAKNPDLIPGIYNYCDRWCERCAFTSRCLQFQMELEEKKDSSRGSGSDELNAEFWKEIKDSLSVAMEMIQDFAEEKGIDLELAMEDEEVEEEMARSEKRREAAREHRCSKAARTYYKMVTAWFESIAEPWQEKRRELKTAFNLELPGRDPEREIIELSDVVDVARWYQYFISAKISRALQGRARERDRDEKDPILAEMPGDADGSAKIALIAIDRSIGAWAILHREFPDREDETLSILAELQRLRNSLESEFPEARAFIRPGFDEE